VPKARVLGDLRRLAFCSVLGGVVWVGVWPLALLVRSQAPVHPFGYLEASRSVLVGLASIADRGLVCQDFSLVLVPGGLRTVSSGEAARDVFGTDFHV
jgi:hypothetical protein